MREIRRRAETTGNTTYTPGVEGGDTGNVRNTTLQNSGSDQGRRADDNNGGYSSANSDNDGLKDYYMTVVSSGDRMADILNENGYKNLQELENYLQDVMGPLDYMLFKNEVEDAGYNVPNTGGVNIDGDENNSYVDEDYYGTHGDYLAAILQKAVQNNEKAREILNDNGYDNFEQLITDMQGDIRPNIFLDMKSKLEGMGYDVPKVGNDAHSGAYVLKPTEVKHMEGG